MNIFDKILLFFHCNCNISKYKELIYYLENPFIIYNKFDRIDDLSCWYFYVITQDGDMIQRGEILDSNFKAMFYTLNESVKNNYEEIYGNIEIVNIFPDEKEPPSFKEAVKKYFQKNQEVENFSMRTK